MVIGMCKQASHFIMYVHMCILQLFVCLCFRYIASFNRQNLGYKLAINHMADYSDVEFRVMRGVIKTSDSPRREVTITLRKDLPSSWNWWLRGKYM